MANSSRSPRQRDRPLIRIFCSISALAAAAGCTDAPTEPDRPVALVVSGTRSRLLIGEATRLEATVRSSAGGTLDGVRVSWTSRDTTTVQVDSVGNATALRAGESWVVATAHGFSDSALVQVAFPVRVGEGALRVRTAASDKVASLLSAEGLNIDFLSRKQAFLIVAQTPNAAVDTAIVVVLPAAPVTGRAALGTWHPSMIDSLDNVLYELQTPIAYFVVGDARSFEVTPLEGWIEVFVVDGVPETSLRRGLFTARLIARGSSYLQSRQQVGVRSWSATGRSHHVVADVRTLYANHPVGTSAGQVTGLPRPATWSMREAWWRYNKYETLPYALAVEDGPPYIDVTLQAPASADIGSGAASVSLYHYDGRTGYPGRATNGRVEITRYAPPPTRDLYGEVIGRIAAGGVMEPYGASPFPFEASFEFHSPLYPEGVQPTVAVNGTGTPDVIASFERLWGAKGGKIR